MYDGHGNMVSNLKINRVFANGTYSNANVAGTSSTHPTSGDRKYDVWGAVRGGNTTGYPNNRYCANLGHVVDDELGHIYMRARYYEPGTGRFLSQDPAMEGGNWFLYVGNDPVNKIDISGESSVIQGAVNSYKLIPAVIYGLNALGKLAMQSPITATVVISQMIFLAAWLGGPNGPDNSDFGLGAGLVFGAIGTVIGCATYGLGNILSQDRVSVIAAHVVFLMTFMAIIDLQSGVEDMTSVFK
jgi:RHS repeat-associated protein